MRTVVLSRVNASYVATGHHAHTVSTVCGRPLALDRNRKVAVAIPYFALALDCERLARRGYAVEIAS